MAIRLSGGSGVSPDNNSKAPLSMESVFSSALVRNEGSMLLEANSFLKVRVLNLLPYIAIFSLLYMYWSTFCAYRSPNVIQLSLLKWESERSPLDTSSSALT